MKRICFSAIALLIGLLLEPCELSARGFGGGGGGGRSMGGGGGNFGGGGHSMGGGGGMSRPSVPNLGASRPMPSRPAPSRPAPSRPNLGSGNFGAGNIGSGNFGSGNSGAANNNRPSVNRPTTRPTTSDLSQINRPTGGFKPSLPTTRPSMPTTLPGNKLPGIKLPGNTGSLGNKLPNRPETRPSIPSLGGGGNRPNFPGNTERPSAGDIGDFLGMDKPVRPSTLPGTTRPGIENGMGDRPNLGNRPGAGDAIANRPNIGNGSGNALVNNRPIDIGEINIGNNTAISNRPSWANIDSGRVTNINNRWQNQIGGLHNWNNVHPNRVAYWAGWGAGVHSSYHWHNRNPGCFRGDWWYSHPYRWGGWHYGYGFDRRPWSYWWTVPTYAACVNWFSWSAPQTVWAQPVYYDYGQGGNVVYNDNSVYINGEQVATASEFAQTAADLATVAPPANEEESKKAEWMSLGTFTVSAGEKDVDPNRIVQLALSKEGIISGTLYNTQTDDSQAIQGKVDKQTQRVAFRIGESEDTIAESGLYNLTQDEAPLLLHLGPEKVENWLLVRLDDPSPEDDASQAR